MSVLRAQTYVVETECVKTRSVLTAVRALRDSTKLGIIATVRVDDKLYCLLVRISYYLLIAKYTKRWGC